MGEILGGQASPSELLGGHWPPPPPPLPTTLQCMTYGKTWQLKKYLILQFFKARRYYLLNLVIAFGAVSTSLKHTQDECREFVTWYNPFL